MPTKLALKINGIAISGDIRQIRFGQLAAQTACN